MQGHQLALRGHFSSSRLISRGPAAPQLYLPSLASQCEGTGARQNMQTPSSLLSYPEKEESWVPMKEFSPFIISISGLFFFLWGQREREGGTESGTEGRQRKDVWKWVRRASEGKQMNYEREREPVWRIRERTERRKRKGNKDRDCVWKETCMW